MAVDRILAGAAVPTLVFSLVGAAWYVGRTTATTADVDALRVEMVDRIADVDGDVQTLRDDMNRQFDRLYELVRGLRDDRPAPADD